MLALLALLLLAGCGGTETEAPATDASEAPAPPPDVDIWLADLEDGVAGLTMVSPRNATDRPGYDNQPHFLPDGTLLYTREEDGDTDIWRYDPTAGEHAAVTETSPESEYSAY